MSLCLLGECQLKPFKKCLIKKKVNKLKLSQFGELKHISLGKNGVFLSGESKRRGKHLWESKEYPHP